MTVAHMNKHSLENWMDLPDTLPLHLHLPTPPEVDPDIAPKTPPPNIDPDPIPDDPLDDPQEPPEGDPPAAPPPLHAWRERVPRLFLPML
jgi:hypothetical protein